MKKILLTILLVTSTLAVEAQDIKWETDIYKAISISNKTKKPMLLFFTGSDWCGWCIRLQKEVLKTSEFANWAMKNVVLVELDYPRGKQQPEAIKQQNAQLQQTFGVQGFPTVYFATATIKKGQPTFTGKGSLGYVPGGPAAWTGQANQILKK